MSAVTRATPGADHAAAELRVAALEHYPELRDRVADMAKTVIKLRGVTDIIEVMAAVNALSLAAEALAKAAQELHQSADAALTASMASTGCSTFAQNGMTVSLRDGLLGVEILSAAAVPLEYLKQPPAQPNKSAIRQFLIANGGSTNWARMTQGAPFLSRRTT